MNKVIARAVAYLIAAAIIGGALTLGTAYLLFYFGSLISLI